MFQTVLGAAFYVGAASEAAGYGRRVTDVLCSVGGEDADADADGDGDGDGDGGGDGNVNDCNTHQEPMVQGSVAATSAISSERCPPILQLHNITINNPLGTTLLRSLSLSLSRGDSCIIVGPSGMTSPPPPL